jgi:putative oxidoreductase
MISGIFAALGRIMLALIFVVAGAAQLTDTQQTVALIGTAGFPASLAIPAALFQLICGAMIVIGIFTRLTALLLAAYCLLTAIIFHSETADPVQAAMAMKNIAIAGGFLCMFAYDQKSWSFDAYRQRRREDERRRVAETSDHPATGAG